MTEAPDIKPEEMGALIGADQIKLREGLFPEPVV